MHARAHVRTPHTRAHTHTHTHERTNIHTNTSMHTGAHAHVPAASCRRRTSRGTAAWTLMRSGSSPACWHVYAFVGLRMCMCACMHADMRACVRGYLCVRSSLQVCMRACHHVLLQHVHVCAPWPAAQTCRPRLRTRPSRSHADRGYTTPPFRRVQGSPGGTHGLRHRRRHVYCPGMDMPVLKLIAWPRRLF